MKINDNVRVLSLEKVSEGAVTDKEMKGIMEHYAITPFHLPTFGEDLGTFTVDCILLPTVDGARDIGPHVVVATKIDGYNVYLPSTLLEVVEHGPMHELDFELDVVRREFAKLATTQDAFVDAVFDAYDEPPIEMRQVLRANLEGTKELAEKVRAIQANKPTLDEINELINEIQQANENIVSKQAKLLK